MAKKPRLTKRQKHELCTLIATFASYPEIQKHFEDKYGIYIYNANIDYYKKQAPQWMQVIEEYREQFNRELLDIPIANARMRLEYLQETYDRAMQWNVEGELRLREPNPNYEPSLPMNKKNPMYVYRVVPKLVCRPAAAVAAIREAHEQVAGRKSKLEVSGPNGKPVPMKMTYFPPEPKTMEEWFDNYQKYLESAETFDAEVVSEKPEALPETTQ